MTYRWIQGGVYWWFEVVQEDSANFAIGVIRVDDFGCPEMGAYAATVGNHCTHDVNVKGMSLEDAKAVVAACARIG